MSNVLYGESAMQRLTDKLSWLKVVRSKGLTPLVVKTNTIQASKLDNGIEIKIMIDGQVSKFTLSISIMHGFLPLSDQSRLFYSTARAAVGSYYRETAVFPPELWKLRAVFPASSIHFQALSYWFATIGLPLRESVKAYDQLIHTNSNELRRSFWNDVSDRFDISKIAPHRIELKETLVTNLSSMMIKGQKALVAAEFDQNHLVFSVMNSGVLTEIRAQVVKGSMVVFD